MVSTWVWHCWAIRTSNAGFTAFTAPSNDIYLKMCSTSLSLLLCILVNVQLQGQEVLGSPGRPPFYQEVPEAESLPQHLRHWMDHKVVQEGKRDLLILVQKSHHCWLICHQLEGHGQCCPAGTAAILRQPGGKGWVPGSSTIKIVGVKPWSATVLITHRLSLHSVNLYLVQI